MDGNLSAWVQRQRDLLDMELQAESSQLSDKIATLSAKGCEVEGLSLLSMEVAGTHSELFGRCAVVLQKIGKHALPNGFKVGDEVTLYNPKLRTLSKDESNELFGVVRKVSQLTIEMVIEEYDERLLETPLRLDKRSSQRTHTKMAEALALLPASNHHLVHLLMSPPTYDIASLVEPRGQLTGLTWHSEGLNSSQQAAVRTCLQAPLFGVIHGPPGTGKTSTLIELILQAIQLKQKILVCAPSNIAVDTILVRLTHALSQVRGHSARVTPAGGSEGNQSVAGVVRLGHPARVVESVLPYTLDHLISHDDGTEIVQDVRREIESLRTQLQQSYTRRKPFSSIISTSTASTMSRQEIKSTLRASRKEASQREREVVRRILQHAHVVLATCVGAGSSLIKSIDFDLVVIDEAAQGLEAACWIPMLRGRKVVLAGDHCQLPPTIKSKEADAGGLGVTLFERVIKDRRFSPVVTLLDVQYRMNDLISQWASREMYGGAVASAPAVAAHSLQDLLRSPTATEPTLDLEDAFPVLLLIDSSGCAMYEDAPADGAVSRSTSHRNQNEAHIVVLHTLALLHAGVLPKDIGVITPYNGQLEVLRDLFAQMDLVKVKAAFGPSSPIQRLTSLEGIDVKTIDGFQGGEKECILISLVRSNDRRDVGFLGERRRINVAVTRAKRHLTLVCDSSTCSHDVFIKTLVEHFEEHGAVVCAEEFLAENSHVAAVVPSAPRPADSASKSAAITAQALGQALAGGTAKAKGAKSTKTTKPVVAKPPTARVIPVSTASAPPTADDFAAQVEAALTKLSQREALPEIVAMGPGGAVRVRCVETTPDDPESRVMVFPSSLSSFQRMIVHAVGDRLQLFHPSIGEGGERHVEASLRSVVGTKKAEVDSAEPQAEEADESAPAATEETVESSDSEARPATAPIPLARVKKGSVSTKKQPPVKTHSLTSTPASKLPNDLDEDALLQLAIAENQRRAEQARYRVQGSAAMPNYDREIAKRKLREKLSESQDARRSAQTEGGKDDKKGPTGGTGRPKVDKKPVPNFGGGILGRK